MDIARILGRHVALARLDGATLRALAADATAHHLVRGEALWREGDPAAAFCVVARGLVLVTRPGRAVRHVAVELAGPVESVGDVDAMEGRGYGSTAIAVTRDAAVLRVPRDAMLGALSGSGAASLAFAAGLSARVSGAQRRLAVFTEEIEARLATVVVELCDRFGDEMEDGTLFIPIQLSRSDVASMAGTTPESVTRVLSRWTREGLFAATEDGMQLLDAAALTRRAHLPAHLPATG